MLESNPSTVRKRKPMLKILHDIFYCTSLTGKALARDEFSLCFQQHVYERKQKCSFRYGISVGVRYGVLLPLRTIFVIATLFFFSVLIILSRVLLLGLASNMLVSLACRVLLGIIGIRVKYYGKKPRPKDPHVFASNHTTYMDYLVLSGYGFSHSVVAQRHTGVMPMLLKLISGSVQFERNVRANRNVLKEELKKVAPSLHTLVFPEGTCVNNEYTVMFQKGIFDLGITVCPVAIKYSKEMGDAFWNTKKQSFSKHFFYMITRWKTDASVWWMPPTARGDEETAAEFAARVKKRISERAGLKNLVWNGYLKHCTTPDEMKEMRMHGGASPLPLLSSYIDR